MLEDLLSGLLEALALKEFDSFRIPRSSAVYQYDYSVLVETFLPAEALTSYVLVKSDLSCSAKQVLVTYHKHSFDMGLKLVVHSVLSVQGDGGSHLEKTITYKLKPFIILAHASLKMDLFVPMFFCIV